MSVSPFDAPAALYREHSTALEDAGVGIPFPEGSGKFHDALTERIALYRTVFLSLSEATATISTACDDQAHADTALASPVTRDDVREQREVFRAAVAAGDTARTAQEKVLLDELWNERKAKLETHAGQCTATDTTLSDADLDTGDIGNGTGLHTPRSAGGESQGDDVQELPGSVSPDDPFMSAPESTDTATPSTADTDAGTALSSDASTGTPRTPSLYTGPPQPVMQPMNTQQGSVGTTPAFGGVPSASQNSGTPSTRTRGTQLNRDPVRGSTSQRARDRKRDTDDRTATDSTVVAGTAPVDRGASSSGTTTRADTSGSVKTNLSGSTPTATPQSPLGHLNGRGPIAPTGGVPPMGSGGGVSGMTKKSPEILTRDPNLSGFDKDAVDNGTLSRDTASTPDFEEWSNKRETANTKRDKEFR
ncbi:Uncharacterised protein [Mycobacteroides abscessus subsp. abscessus]|uniref:hypothetical protein n=1 Tax=Mycobacteroides abscessus TaxID=36809 RepID=UPI0009A6C7F9|nr:hypothetical protein [Mycobacteroides abscessus]SKV12445.1 Uncharacterised protein [Mycobacteroides abscessus subsp. abscessus]